MHHLRRMFWLWHQFCVQLQTTLEPQICWTTVEHQQGCFTECAWYSYRSTRLMGMWSVNFSHKGSSEQADEHDSISSYIKGKEKHCMESKTPTTHCYVFLWTCASMCLMILIMLLNKIHVIYYKSTPVECFITRLAPLGWWTKNSLAIIIKG